MLERLKESIDKGGKCGTLFIGLSKAFNPLQNHILLAKQEVYGFSNSSLKMTSSFLSNRKYRIKINYLFSFITDSNIIQVNYSDVTTPYACNRNMNDITKLFLISSSGLKITKPIMENHKYH